MGCGIVCLIFCKNNGDVYAYALLPVLGHNLKQRQYHTK
ncbi:hypothetical protein COO91_06516 [Nostoc flagelliforme CCNUN1]|uniref:Uncharacterized protein n=1 Tax=Nostoc flagelliforme CCNUN1 TaxID=2038116 RepID=A0A2K8SYH6_9NOSO|nr:hypothetical protein COO91_06516 [Nostoc flagelliforme CCNUN1]